jgi:hypothetical protein
MAIRRLIGLDHFAGTAASTIVTLYLEKLAAKGGAK